MAPVGAIYIMEISPPCRAVLLTAKALNIELTKVIINVLKGENKTPEFLKLNPAHSVPTYLDNDGTSIGDSHAIMIFLVQKYGPENCPLHPSDIRKQAQIHQRLHFDSGNVFSLHIAILYPMIMRHETGPSAHQIDAADRMYEILNRFLEDQLWICEGEHYTIADLSLVTSIEAIKVLVPMDHEKYVNIVEWINRCEEIPFFHEINYKGQERYAMMLNEFMDGNQGVVEKYQ